MLRSLLLGGACRYATSIASRAACVKPETRRKREVLGEIHEIMPPRLTKRLHLCKIVLIG